MKKKTFFRAALWTIGGIITFVAIRKLIVKKVIERSIRNTTGIGGEEENGR